MGNRKGIEIVGKREAERERERKAVESRGFG